MKEMITWVLRFGRHLLALKEQVAKNTAEINEIRNDLHDLTEAVRALTYSFQRNQENDAHEREKLQLRLENLLLRYVPQLPPSDDGNLGLRSQEVSPKPPPE
jgi:hypothetical protein